MWWKKKSPFDKKLFEAKKRSKYIRNVQRLKEYYEAGNLKGVDFQMRYLRLNGIEPPQTYDDCDKLIQVLTDVA